MPLESGGALRRMPAAGTSDLLVCGPLRQPPDKHATEPPQIGPCRGHTLVTCTFSRADRGSPGRFLGTPVPAHVTIQKSWRSSIIRAPITATWRTARSSSGYMRT
jgi:hypothetical protein